MHMHMYTKLFYAGMDLRSEGWHMLMYRNKLRNVKK